MIFVYNANSGALNALFDVMHKVISPQTYNCQLSAITFDTFFENIQWQNFRERNNVNMAFLYKDEFEARYGKVFAYPIVLSKGIDEAFTVLLNAKDLSAMKTTNDLVSALLDNPHEVTHRINAQLRASNPTKIRAHEGMVF